MTKEHNDPKNPAAQSVEDLEGFSNQEPDRIPGGTIFMTCSAEPDDRSDPGKIHGSAEPSD